ncbi:YcaO-like family protein [Streptomyces sp. Amel2xC10]|uniref:YcaO-like family protein n=1 Tax=Streptomyces sp. Amel2xC10 TaxID=1305826 RepID=UPI000A08218E|nr:YcaO-like family protein [Streptomyces sp. Amel2xC10]SMF78969.1 thiazole/oxazole-forming peptide maturase, SagD family component [Streptomyces sp. Amel2xC10]
MSRIATRGYPGMTTALARYARIGGNQGGILPGMLVSPAAVAGEPHLRSATAAMPQYHRLALRDPHMQMQYHLAGYGGTHEEAVTRLTGEAVERYAAMMAMPVFRHRVEYATYRALSSRHRCLPLELLGIFDAAQQRRIAGKLHRYSPELPREDDVIAWIACPSLTRPGEEVYLPAQLFFLGFRSNAVYADKLFTPSFSTGTAAHVSFDKALLGALVEAVQIDAFILNWYTDAKAPVIEPDTDGRELLASVGLRPDGPYEVRATYLTRPELPLPNIGVTLVRRDRKLPYIAFGLQADPDPRQALMRGAAEATAILAIGMYSTIFDLPNVHYAQSGSSYTDLDTNVLYFATPNDAERKLAAVESRTAGHLDLGTVDPYASDDESAIRRLIGELSGVSEWAGCLDITPPALADTPWKVVRVLVPELLSMCLPGFPANAHPRMRSYGGVTHVVPHPLP